MKRIIKLCGFQDVTAVHALHGLDVDMAGFIMAPSKRQLSLDRMQELAAHVPSRTKKVGVFVNPSFAALQEVFCQVRFEVLQLHGQESPEFCRQVRDVFEVEIIKAFHVSADRGDSSIHAEFAGVIDYVLLDTYDAGAAGGTGKSFQWSLIPRYQQWCASNRLPLLVAGGITPDNVGDLVHRWEPDGIDVSSGIETNGFKDIDKISLFVRKVREHDHSAK
jgi:phosphoribosylanthranilate isomerase